MFCTNCGAKNKDEARFCTSCGSPLNRRVNNNENTMKMHYIKEELENIEPVYEEEPKSNKGIKVFLITLFSIIGLSAVCFIGYKIAIEASSPKPPVTAENKAPAKEEKKEEDSNKSNVIYGENKDESNKNNGDYILPESDSKMLTKEDISSLSKERLAYARNEIYARHGYVFNSQAYKDYFGSKPWYSENPNFKGNESELNSFEKANVKLIKSMEGN